jgi:hypothetical protein
VARKGETPRQNTLQDISIGEERQGFVTWRYPPEDCSEGIPHRDPEDHRGGCRAGSVSSPA